MNQAEAFLKGAGDVWHDLNSDDLGKNDPVTQLMDAMGIIPKRVFEVGCSTGWRLKKLRDKYGCMAGGTDPSQKAITEGKRLHGRDISLAVGIAEELPQIIVDVLIYGFCLFFVDPKNYFRVVMNGDAVLADGGLLIVHDRLSPFPVKRQYAVQASGEELMFYTMNFPGLWLSHPFYKQIAELNNPDNFETVTVLQKNVDGFMRGTATPKNPAWRHD